jgi:hypothetical protein
VKYIDPDGRNPALSPQSGTFSSGERYDINIISIIPIKIDVRTSVNDGTAIMPSYSQTTTITYDNNGNISQTDPRTINHPYTNIDGTEDYLSPFTISTAKGNPRVVGDIVVYDTITSRSGGMTDSINFPSEVTLPDIRQIDVTITLTETGESVTGSFYLSPPAIIPE